MEGDESRRISALEWRLNDIERQIATLSDAQKRVEETILKLSSAVDALTAAGNAPAATRFDGLTEKPGMP